MVGNNFLHQVKHNNMSKQKRAKHVTCTESWSYYWTKSITKFQRMFTGSYGPSSNATNNLKNFESGKIEASMPLGIMQSKFETHCKSIEWRKMCGEQL